MSSAKVKKPVKLPFLNFSTVELRRHYCREEVRINRPWAPNVSLRLEMLHRVDHQPDVPRSPEVTFEND